MVSQAAGQNLLRGAGVLSIVILAAMVLAIVDMELFVPDPLTNEQSYSDFFGLFHPTEHFGTLLLSIFSCGLGLSALRHGRPVNPVAFFILISVATLSDF